MGAVNKRPDLDPVELVRLYTEEDYSLKDLARRFGTSPTTVRNRLLDNKVKLRRPGLVDMPTHRKI